MHRAHDHQGSLDDLHLRLKVISYLPLPRIFIGFMCLPKGRRTLWRKLPGVGETDTPTAYPYALWLSCSMEILGRSLEAVPESTYVVPCVRSRYDL